MIQTGLTIDSPEGISFSYQLASLTERALAYGLDLLIRIAVMVALGIGFALALGPAIFAGIGLWLILYFGVEWGYYVAFELLWNGQSPGKRVLGLRVVKTAGHPVGFFDSVLRNLLRAADALPPLALLGSYGFGAISMLVTRKFQRLGDLAASTIVVLERKTPHFGRWRTVDPASLPSIANETLLRGVRLSNRERQMLADFAERRPRLHPQRCEELAAILAGPLAKRLGHAPGDSATDFLLTLHNQANHEGGPYR